MFCQCESPYILLYRLVPYSTNLALLVGSELFETNSCLNREAVRNNVDWEKVLSELPSLLSFSKQDLAIHGLILRELFNINNRQCGMMHDEFVDMIEKHAWLLRPNSSQLLGKFRLLIEYGNRAFMKAQGYSIGPYMQFTNPHAIEFASTTEGQVAEQHDCRISYGYKQFIIHLLGHVRVLRYPWQRLGRVKYWSYCQGLP